MEYYKLIEKPSMEREYYSDVEYFNNILNEYNKLKQLEKCFIINEGTEDEKIFVDINEIGEFIVTILSREDFDMRGYDASGLTNKQMQSIADDMGESLVEYGGYWDMIENFGDDLNLPHNEVEDEDDEVEDEDNWED